MPELAEVEYYRKQWDVGIGRRVTRVHLHAGKRAVRDLSAKSVAALEGATLLGSEARAKQMLFRFGRRGKTTAWLGIHLGMTGKLHVAPSRWTPGRHDHLALRQSGRWLVFTDPRMFGRVRLHLGPEVPGWWSKLPPDVLSEDFTLDRVRGFLTRRGGSSVKALLLMQDLFPGVGNWMADEILWHAGIDPRTRSAKLTAAGAKALWRESRKVCRVALATVGVDFSDPPEDWLFHARWTAQGECPRCGLALKTATIGGRTTRWCPRCQS
jgi:formamidopyrimidine-DNA glycosylase